MYFIEVTDYGLKLTLEGKLTLENFSDLTSDMRSAILKVKKPFNLLTDVSKLKPFNGFGHATFLSIQEILLKYGMVKNAKVYFPKGQAIRLWSDILGSETGMINIEKRFEILEEAEEYLRGEKINENN